MNIMSSSSFPQHALPSLTELTGVLLRVTQCVTQSDAVFPSPKCSQRCRHARLLLWYVARIIARNYIEMGILPAYFDREVTEENKLLHPAVVEEETGGKECEKNRLVRQVTDYRCEIVLGWNLCRSRLI